MPLKTVIPTLVDNSEFVKSVATLNRFARVVDRTGDGWIKYGASVMAAQKTANEITKHIQDHYTIVDKASASSGRFKEAVRTAGSIFTHMARDTRAVAENLARSTFSLLNIATVTGAIAGLIGFGGGLFGMDQLAQGVATRRKAALGLGVSYGQLSSFDLNFGRYGDAQAILGGVGRGVYDYTSPEYTALLSSGVTPGSGNAADSALELMKKLPQIFGNTPDELVGPKANALGITQIMSVKEIIAYLHSTSEERQRQIQHYETDRNTLDVSAEAQGKWADFQTALTRAGRTIETVLADQLVGLADPIAHVSDGFISVIDALSKFPDLNKKLTRVESGMEWFAGFLGSDDVKREGKRFIAGLEALTPLAIKMMEIAGVVIKAAIVGERLINPDDPYNPSSWSRVVDDIAGPGASDVAPKGHWLGNRGPSIRYGTRGQTYIDDTPGALPQAGHPSLNTSPQTMVTPIPGEGPDQLAARIQSVRPELTTGQCVELAFKMSGIPYTSANVINMRRGPAATDSGVPPGTPVGTFFNQDRSIGDRYAAGGTGTPRIGRDHMGVKAGFDSKGELVLVDQWSGKAPGFTPYVIGNQPGSEHDANAYFALMDARTGLPAGTYEHNPYLRQVLGGIAADRFSGGAMSVSKYLSRPHSPQDAIDAAKAAKPKLQKTSMLNHLSGAKSDRHILVIDNSSSSVASSSHLRFA